MHGRTHTIGMLLAAAVMLLTVAPAPAQKKFDPLSKAVVKLQAVFVPAEARPGQTVSLQIHVHLADGYYTYPLHQPDKAAQEMINALTVSPNAPLIAVGVPSAISPVKSKPEPLLGIKEMRYLAGVVAYEQKFVVSPKATPTTLEATPALQLSVCSENNCYPPKTVKPTATLKILGGPAVEIEPAYRDAVEKAASGL